MTLCSSHGLLTRASSLGKTDGRFVLGRAIEYNARRAGSGRQPDREAPCGPLWFTAERALVVWQSRRF